VLEKQNERHGEREKKRERKTKPSLPTLPILNDNDNVSVQMHAEKTEDRNGAK
jgi:hypothetical protein